MINIYASNMRRGVVFLLIFGSISIGYSQKKFEGNLETVPLSSKAFKIRGIKPKVQGPPKVVPYVPDVIAENTFKVPKNDAIVAPEVYRRNQDLGIFKTSSKMVNVKYRDGAYVDGDKIRIYVNYKVLEYETLLDESYKGLEINLEKGVNRIDFEALNEGFAAPNTAEFQVYDDQGKLISSSQWNIGSGYKATIIIEKQ
jgi:hypothetical protein